MTQQYDLSILIPALEEEFISNTVNNIISNKRGRTEVIVILDGKWAEPGIDDHPDVRVIKLGKNLGQRGATNVGARLSRAKYVAKTDAHCAFDEGFDVKLMQAVEGHDDWTIVPAMKNLHAFNWVCSNCQREYYQGEKPDKCPDELCQFVDTTFSKKIYFIPRDMSDFHNRRGPTSTAYRFTPDNLQFKYFGQLEPYQTEEVSETMSLQGSFFMLTRQKYWELNICDESWGGWGQQGTEVALKTWLSGGRVVVHKGTWYAHMFRTNRQISFPWNKGLQESQGKQQARARKACVELFKQNRWDKQVRPLSWLVERFWEPLQKEPSNTDGADRKWTVQDLEELRKTEARFNTKAHKGIIYYTSNTLPVKIGKKVQQNLQNISQKYNIPITSVSLKPMDNFGTNLIYKGEPGYKSMFNQILMALENCNAEIVYFCEHDVLYHPSHFDFEPSDPQKFYYNQNFWKVRADGKAVHWDANQVSGLVGYREHLLDYYRKRLAELETTEFNRSYEPGGRDPSQYEAYFSKAPNIDIRGNWNMTRSKWSPADFRDKSLCINWHESTYDQIPGWQPSQFSGILE